MSFEIFNEYKKEIIVATIVGVGGFFLGQSFQALENKAVMDSKNYVGNEIEKMNDKVDVKIDTLNSNIQDKLKHYDEKVIQVLVESSKTVKAAEESLANSDAIIKNAKNALNILNEKDSELKKLIESNAGITSESVAIFLKEQIKKEILKEIGGQLSQENITLTQKVGSIEQTVQRMDEAFQYTIVSNINKCPPGWFDQGVIGIIMEEKNYGNNLGNGGSYADGWRWTHPRLCKK